MSTSTTDPKPSSLDLIYEDDELFVVNKPAGVLSQPGRSMDGSIATQAKACFPNATGPMLVHRLDMDTSGLLMLAKTAEVHRALQALFEKRQVFKQYVAVLQSVPKGLGGLIQLPLRLDVDNRPVQIVCYEHGKPSTTVWRKDSRYDDDKRVVLFPMTGRTHQLRVHAQHSLGLNNAIKGDRLYGQAGVRLCLHAEVLRFVHPVSQQLLSIQADVPF